MCKICIIAAVWLLEKKKNIYIFLQRVHYLREEKGANLLVFSEKWLSRIQGFFNVSQFYWKNIAEFDARILHTRLICRSKIFFAAERSPLEYFEQELLFVWNWYYCPKVFFFFAKIIIKEKTIDWNWSVYVVLKNSIIVFANCEKNAKSFLRWPGSRLSRQYVLTTLPNLLDKKKVFQSQTYFYIHMY